MTSVDASQDKEDWTVEGLVDLLRNAPADKQRDFESAREKLVSERERSNWDTFLEILLSKLSTPIPSEFKVAAGSANHSVMTRPPARFNLHLPPLAQLHYVKWAPHLIQESMEKLKVLHPGDTPTRDPGDRFWYHHDIHDNTISLGDSEIVTGEAAIQGLTDSDFLRPICSIVSRILFHLDEDPPTAAPHRYGDIIMQTSDTGPPLWDSVVKLRKANGIGTILVEQIIYALELKSLTVAPSSFFFRLCSRAAANVLGTPVTFPYQSCKQGILCPHAKNYDHLRYDDGPAFFNNLEELPDFDPSPDELQQLLACNRVLNDDLADNNKRVHLEAPNLLKELSGKPRARIALAIIRTGAINLDSDTCDDPDAKALASDVLRASPRGSAPSNVIQKPRFLSDCKKWKWSWGVFDEHHTCVLQQLWAEMVHRDLTFAALTTLKHAVMVYRSRTKQTLYVSTPFHPGARSPTLSQALLSQIISAYQEAKGRAEAKVSHPDKGPTGGKGVDNNQGAQGSEDGPGRHGDRDDGEPSRDEKRKKDEHEPYPNKSSRDGSVSDDIEIPSATLSAKEQLHLSKSIRIGETHMCIHDGFYDSEVSALLMPVDCSSRPGPPPSSPVPSMTRSASTGSDSSMESVELLVFAESTPSSLCLTQKLGRGAIGDVWKGVYLNSTNVFDVAAKVGWVDDVREQFIHEAKIYDILQKKNINGVPVLIGLFDDMDDRVPILVTTYAGPEISTVDDSLKRQFRQILQDLHEIGICHGDLRKENMCCLDGRGCIIDFDHAFETTVGEDFAEDENALERVLASY